MNVARYIKEVDAVIQRLSGKYFLLKKLKKLTGNRAFFSKGKGILNGLHHY